MTRAELIAFYQERWRTNAETLSKVKSNINTTANLRLISALAIAAAIYFAFQNVNLIAIVVVLVGIFFVLVKRHAGQHEERTHLEDLSKVIENERLALEGNFSTLYPGTEFINGRHPYTHDLDIFGEGSLFQYVNRCNTLGGRAAMAERLSSKLPSIEQIKRDQLAIASLAKHSNFRIEIQATGLQLAESMRDRHQLKEWIEHPDFIFNKPAFRFLLIGLPVATIVLLGCAIAFDGFAKFFWLAAAIQWAILATQLKRVNAFHFYITSKKSILEKYARMVSLVENFQAEETVMTNLASEAKNASAGLRRLSSLVGAFDARLNMMTNLFVNSVLMYDLQCVYRLEAWKASNASKLLRWIDVIHEVEVLCSFGTYYFNNPSFVFPEVDQHRALQGQAVGHPLIPADELVANDVALSTQSPVMIITGANMAGKSTFLRTVGVNVVLALAGAPVAAQAFRCPYLDLRTGMRTADSLKDHQSYFYAELNRLKSIVDELHSGKELLVLLDEILKGTNSNDKQAGSIALVKQLLGYPCLVMVATHDLVLGNLETEQPGLVTNYCFEPEIKGDELMFDYKLRRGIAQKMNATFLMKKMGIIPKE